jgi:small-conductance mechanosensitive channel
MQYKIERGRFDAFRRALLLAEDKRLFADLWNRAEFHVPAAEKAAHPLPIATILMMVNLEQEKTIYQLRQRTQKLSERAAALEKENQKKAVQIAYLNDRLEDLERNLEDRLAAFRAEVLEIKYEYVP